MKQAPVFLLISFLVVSCAAHLPYPANAPVTSTRFSSPLAHCEGIVPAGWFTSLEDSAAPGMLALLVREDFRAAIALRELALNALAAREGSGKGLKTLARISSTLQQPSLPESPDKLQVDEYRIGTREYCSYELGHGGAKKRIVVFSEKGRYYQCEALPLKGEWSEAEIGNLFKVQQTVLANLRF